MRRPRHPAKIMAQLPPLPSLLGTTAAFRHRCADIVDGTALQTAESHGKIDLKPRMTACLQLHANKRSPVSQAPHRDVPCRSGRYHNRCQATRHKWHLRRYQHTVRGVDKADGHSIKKPLGLLECTHNDRQARRTLAHQRGVQSQVPGTYEDRLTDLTQHRPGH